MATTEPFACISEGTPWLLRAGLCGKWSQTHADFGSEDVEQPLFHFSLSKHFSLLWGRLG